MDLSFNSLKVLPGTIDTSFSSIISLKLRGNELEELPNAICGLGQLQVLDVCVLLLFNSNNPPQKRNGHFSATHLGVEKQHQAPASGYWLSTRAQRFERLM